MRAQVQTTNPSAACLASLIQTANTGVALPAKGGRGKPYISDGKINEAIDAFEGGLKAGAKVPAHAHPLRPHFGQIAAMLGVNAKTLRAKHLKFRKRINSLAERYGLEQRTASNAFAFSKFTTIALAHQEKELNQESPAARDRQVLSFANAMQMVAADCELDQDARSALVSAVTLAGINGADLPLDFLNEIKRAISYLDKWDANEDLPNNPGHLLSYALARSGLSERSVCIGAGMGQGRISRWIKGGVGPQETQFPRVNLVEQAFNLPRETGHLPFPRVAATEPAASPTRRVGLWQGSAVAD